MSYISLLCYISGDAEGFRKEHVNKKVVEVASIKKLYSYSKLNSYTSSCVNMLRCVVMVTLLSLSRCNIHYQFPFS